MEGGVEIVQRWWVGGRQPHNYDLLLIHRSHELLLIFSLVMYIVVKKSNFVQKEVTDHVPLM